MSKRRDGGSKKRRIRRGGWTMNTVKRYDSWQEGKRERKEGQT